MTPQPVSALVEEELVAEVQRQGILVWLDKDAAYTKLVDRLAARHAAGEFAVPVVGFRGSYLEALFALERFGSGYDKHALVVHMPGHAEDTVRQTPVLELYSAGTRYRKSLETAIRSAATGRVVPAEVDAFLATKPTLEQADVWLARAMTDRTSAIEPLLEASGRMLLIEALVGSDGGLATLVTTAADEQALRSYVHKLTGMDDAWFARTVPDSKEKALEQVRQALGAWVLCVEYVHDLVRQPALDALRPLRDLSKPLVEVCQGMARELRQKHGKEYERLADDTESMLADELRAMRPEDLGKIDTFREEENQVLRGAVLALQQGAFPQALEWFEAREGDRSFWLGRDPARRRAWDLVGEAARFGTLLAGRERPFQGLTSFEDALERYARDASPVDRAHRHLAQEWLRRGDTQLPHYGDLEQVFGELRRRHRAWADQLARDFTRLCREQGFRPGASLEQRSLYEDVVQPLAFGGEKVAVFLIDAFRYEMATELSDELRAAKGASSVDLKPRLAELPTITAVGMNALAPVAREGRLEVAGTFEGFRGGEYTVRSRDDRARAMGTRTSGKPALRLDLAELCESPVNLTRRVRDHQIVVVTSSEIDDAGEANVGLYAFEALLRQIRAAWHHLQQAGIHHAVFTADHGFLLLDATTEKHDFGKRTDPKPRFVLDPHERGEAGMVPVPVASLGYDGVSGYLLFREDTALFKTCSAAATYVHGGNSPQERIIPVLTVTRRRIESASLAEYAIEAEAMQDAFGCHRVRLRLVFPKDSQTSLGFVGARSIELDLRVPARADVRVLVREVAGAGAFAKGRIAVPVGDAWTDVFFGLEGPADERLPIEVYHPDRIEKVRAASPDALFTSMGSGTRPPPPQFDWTDSIEEEPVRRVLQHIEKHGAITEAEATTLLGSARATRRFSLSLESYLVKLPFKVRTEANDSGKRWVREEDEVT